MTYFSILFTLSSFCTSQERGEIQGSRRAEYLALSLEIYEGRLHRYLLLRKEFCNFNRLKMYVMRKSCFYVIRLSNQNQSRVFLSTFISCIPAFVDLGVRIEKAGFLLYEDLELGQLQHLVLHTPGVDSEQRFRLVLRTSSALLPLKSC